MPLRPLAIGFVLVCLALATLLAAVIVRGLRRRRWLALAAALPALGLIILAALPVPYIFGIGAPHPVFNGPAPASSSAVAYQMVSLGKYPSPALLVAVEASSGKQLWQRELPNRTSITQASGAPAVFAASALDNAAQPTQPSAQLSAFDATTGSVLWQRELPGATPSGAPVLVGGALVVSINTVGAPSPQQLLALSLTDGHQLWSVVAGPRPVGGLQLLPGGGLVFDMPDAYTLQTRGTGDGRLLWETSQPDPLARFIIGADAVYLIASNGTVTAFAAQTGATLWRFSDPKISFHTGAFAADALYVSGQRSTTPQNAAGNSLDPTMVYALDARTGAQRWKVTIASPNAGSVYAGPSGAFIQADDGIHGLRSADGRQMWYWPAQDNRTIPFIPSFIGSVAYMYSEEHLPPETLTILQSPRIQTYLYAVDASTGAIFWAVPVGPVITHPWLLGF
jgi:outer membrane protein assembly factor BamB